MFSRISFTRREQAYCEFALTLLCALLAVGIAWAMHGGTGISWHAPLTYTGDGIYYLLTTQRLIDGTGYFINSRQGFPFDSFLFDFPGADGGTLLALWTAAKLTGSAVLANNAYYLSGFALAAIAGLWTLRRFGASLAGSFTGALLFSVLPFHFMRLGHLYYTWYFVVPLYFWYAFELYKGGSRIFGKQIRRWCRLGHCMALFALACFGVYYAFFGVMALLLGAVLGWQKYRNARPLMLGIASTVLVCLGVMINIAPNIALTAKYGSNEHIAKRTPAESDEYGLKFTQLLLPRPAHRSTALAEINARYARNSPYVNENAAASLGIVGGVGLLVLLCASISYPVTRTPRLELLRFLGVICLAMMIFATAGGFSSLFAHLVSPQLRAWNRISIYIGFLSLAAIAIAVDLISAHFRARRREFLHFTSFFLIGAFALWDQTSPENIHAQRASQTSYFEEQSYFNRLEQSLPRGTAVYQLPFMGFPEAPARSALGAYDLGKGFLLTKHMKWSFGAATGRDGAGFLETLETRPLALQLEIARFFGFTGFLIDRRGYKDRGAQMAEESSVLLNGIPPTTDTAGNLLYFSLDAIQRATSTDDLSSSARALLAEWGIQKSGEVIQFLPGPESFEIDFSRSLQYQLSLARGMSDPEPWGAWTDGKVQTLKFKRTLPDRFVLKIKAQAFGPNVGQPVQILVGDQIATFMPNATLQTFSLPFALAKRTDSIQIVPAFPASPRALGLSADGRSLGIGIERLSID